MPIETLLERFKQRLGLKAPLNKSEEGVYHLDFPPDYHLSILPLSMGLFLSSLMVPIPKEGGKEALYIYLMKANLMGQGTGGGAIGIDPTGSFFTFSQNLRLEVDESTFKEAIEDLLNYTSYWREEITNFYQERVL